MLASEEKKCCDTKLSQCVGVVSTSSDIVQASSESPGIDQEQEPVCFLAVIRDQYGIVLQRMQRRKFGAENQSLFNAEIRCKNQITM